jgi:hypothetical protein
MGYPGLFRRRLTICRRRVKWHLSTRSRVIQMDDSREKYWIMIGSIICT